MIDFTNEVDKMFCPLKKSDIDCYICNHENCGWCPECHPEVPEWTDD